MSWVCNQAGCAVKLNSTREAENHVASTVDTPDLNKLLEFEKITEQEEYVLKYMNWYIVYGKNKRVQRMLKRLVPRLFPSVKEKQVCSVGTFLRLQPKNWFWEVVCLATSS